MSLFMCAYFFFPSSLGIYCLLLEVIFLHWKWTTKSNKPGPHNSSLKLQLPVGSTKNIKTNSLWNCTVSWERISKQMQQMQVLISCVSIYAFPGPACLWQAKVRHNRCKSLFQMWGDNAKWSSLDSSSQWWIIAIIRTTLHRYVYPTLKFLQF